MQKNINKYILITSLLLFFTLILFDLTSIDLFVQDYFFNLETNSWIWDSNEPISKIFLYDGIKKLLIFFAFVILFSLILFRKKEIIKTYKKGLIIVLLSAIIIPVTVGLLKATTNMPCPKNIEYFGGKYPDVKLLDSYPTEFIQKKKIKCWPAGHASGGFALLSLFFLFKKRINQMYALSFALTVGWSMGAYKMLIGDHFLSHTIITMLIAWLLVLIIYKIINSIEKEKY